MEAKQVVLQNKGMHQDESISKSTNEYAYENYGIRITGELDNTSLSITNEKGPKKLGALKGIYLGHCCAGGYIIVFTCSSDNKTSYIYKVSPNYPFSAKVLFKGDLGFNTDYPIESIGWYESADIIKVYWIDDIHSPRFINIAKPENIKSDDIYQFDFTPQIGQLPSVIIEKDYSKSGMFSEGTIQYFFSYYNKFGAETGIIWQSSVQYISFRDRGAKADENVNCAFNIALQGVNTNFDYVRIYSAQRGSQDGPINARLVADVKIENGTISYTDLGTNGESIDPSLLYYIGGQSFKAETLAQKDGVLFFGNINISSTSVSDDIKSFIKSRIVTEQVYIDGEYSDIKGCTDIAFTTKAIEASPQEGYYSHTQQINHSQYNIATFKYGEIYRFAIQFMTKTGEWTSAIWLGDKVCQNDYPRLSTDRKYYIVPTAVWKMPDNLRDLVKNDYAAYRILLADTSVATRKILAQGVVSPSLFNYYERYYNKPHSIASWNFRPRNSDISSDHLEGINTQYRRISELQGLRRTVLPLFNIDQATIEQYTYYHLIFGVDAGTEMVCKLILFNLPEGQDELDQKAIYEKVIAGKMPLPAYNSGKPIDKTTGSYREILSVREDKSTWNKVITAIFNDMTDKCEEYGKEVSATIKTPPILESQMPSRGEIKDILSWQYGTKAWSIVLSALVIAAGVAMSVVSWGSAAGAAAAASATAISAILSTLGGLTAEALGLSIAILGAASTCQSIIDSIEATKIEKSLARKGWVYFGKRKEAKMAIDSLFENISNFPSFQGTNNGSFWLTGGRLTFKKASEVYADNNKDQFYVDDSLVTFNSPELEDNQDVIDNNQALDMKIVGYIPIQSNYTKYIIEQKNAGFENLSGIIADDTSFNNPLYSADTEGLLSGYLYQDSYLKTALDTDSPKVFRQGSIVPYKTFLWNRETSLSIGGGYTAKLADDQGDDLGYMPAQLQHKIFANMRYSTNTEYLTSYPWTAEYGIWPVRVFNSDEVTTINIERDPIDYDYYYGNYDGVATFSNKYEILTSDNYTETESNTEFEPDVKVPYGKGISSYNPTSNIWEYKDEGSSDSLMIVDPVRIKFKSTPHAVISFKPSGGIQPILPIFNTESYDIANLYSVKAKKGGSDLMYDKYNFYSELDGETMASESVLNDFYAILGDTNAETITLDLRKYGRSIWIKQEGDEDIAFNIDGAFQTIGQYIIGELRHFPTFTITVVDVFKKLIAVKNIIFKVIYTSKDGETPATVWVCLKKIDGTDTTPEINMKIISVPDNIIMDMVYAMAVPDYYDKYKSRYKISGTNVYRYNGHPIYVAKKLSGDRPSYPYLYIAELYKKNFKYSEAYDSPERLSWNICSSVTSVDVKEVITYGDTYYQRWDCLKTYPFTEEDTNSIVDILSFMVETHKNLDGRCDINRGISNILNARPTNWNLMNNAYTQNDDMIRYNVLDKKFDLSRFSNQVIWSLPKVDSADIDTWTNITLNNSLSLDGSYGGITKLISNGNGALIAFQSKAISIVNYNNSTALSTESGVPIEIANSGKVTGYTLITNSAGCLDKWASCSGGAGIYFIDHYNKSMYLLNGSSLVNISAKNSMSKFFRNITDNTETWAPSISPLPVRLSCDGITNDIYINSGEYSLLYNEKLGTFTSFMPYEDMIMFSNSGKSLAIDASGNFYEMFKGEYNIDKYGNQIDYYMDYRVNPEPLTDKVFTNIEYVADTFSPSSPVDGQMVLDRENPFSKLEVWNEYQYGQCELKEQVMPTDLRQKFRIWRAQIPRDENSKYKLDRIRNPWCHIKLSKTTTDNKKMEFHQLTTTYFK